MAFQSGLVILAVALLMDGAVTRWIPVLMTGHAVLSPVAQFIPDQLLAALTA